MKNETIKYTKDLLKSDIIINHLNSLKREIIKYAKDPHVSDMIIDYLDSLEYKNKDQGEIEHIYVVKFLEWLGMRVKDSEMRNLGYIVPKFNWYCLNKKYRGKYVRNNEDLIYSDDIIIFYDINEAREYKGNKIVCLDSDIYLYNIEISKEFTMPRYVHGCITLRESIIPEIFIMPQYVRGGVDLGGLTIPEGFKMPKYVDGYLYMRYTEIPKGLIMPQYVGGNLDMEEAIIPEGFVMPQYVGCCIDLKGVTIPKGFIFPKDVMGAINLKNSTIPKDFVVPEYLSVVYL